MIAKDECPEGVSGTAKNPCTCDVPSGECHTIFPAKDPSECTECACTTDAECQDMCPEPPPGGGPESNPCTCTAGKCETVFPAADQDNCDKCDCIVDTDCTYLCPDPPFLDGDGQPLPCLASCNAGTCASVYPAQNQDTCNLCECTTDVDCENICPEQPDTGPAKNPCTCEQGTCGTIFPAADDCGMCECETDEECGSKCPEGANGCTCEQGMCIPYFNPTTCPGGCTIDANGESPECKDNNFCTTNNACLDGQCYYTAVVCEDYNPCTIGSCDPSVGCLFTKIPDCQGCAASADCDDSNFCTVDTCDTSGGPTQNWENYCTHTPKVGEPLCP